MGRVNNMEIDMACKCGAPLIIKGNKLVCSANCGYEREIIKPVPSQAELLKENEQLKQRILELETLLRMHRIVF